MGTEAGDARTVRKRRAHKKSRQGCANCKLRGIKCDETKPSCKRCESFNVLCRYGSGNRRPSDDDGILSAKPSFRVQLETSGFSVPVSARVPSSPPAPLPIAGSRFRSGAEAYQLVRGDIPLIEKFQQRTVWTLGTAATHHVYANTALRMAFSSPLLMHVILALAEIHELCVTSPCAGLCRLTPSLTYHWYQAVSSMYRHLSEPIIPAERDSLWMAANLISISNIAHVEARSPEDAWPLRPKSPADLSWLKICDGQRQIAQLTKPMRHDSEVSQLAQELCDMSVWVYKLGSTVCRSAGKDAIFQGLPEGFAEFFGFDACLTDSSGTAEPPEVNDEDTIGATTTTALTRSRDDNTYAAENPYYTVATILAQLFRVDLNEDNLLVHVCFATSLDDRLRELLRAKDEKAMLLLLYWYAKICDRRIWWLCKQSYVEGFGICQYLETAWRRSGDEDGLKLLEAPRAALMAAIWGKHGKGSRI